MYSKDNEEIKGGSEYGKNRVYETGGLLYAQFDNGEKRKYQQENTH